MFDQNLKPKFLSQNLAHIGKIEIRQFWTAGVLIRSYPILSY